MDYLNITVIIPSLNPDEKLLNTVCELEQNGFDDIIIVNDGSDEQYLKYFPNLDEHPCCTILSHRRNRGKGAALKSAFKFFLNFRQDKAGVITIDSDGQHKIEDIINCATIMCQKDVAVLGCRNFNLPNVPARSRFGNKLTSVIFKLFCGLKVSDTQTGLRAIPAKHIEDLINVKGLRYEYETNMLLEFKKRAFGFEEVPIETVYINDNETSHFRPFVDSIRIYKLIFSFMFSSLISMAVEVLAFYLLLKFIFKGGYDIALATVVSRFISSVVNFYLNRKKVFCTSEGLWQTLLRYTVLAIPLALGSMLSIKGLTLLFGAKSELVKTLFKIVVDTILFFVSFRVQQNWVFAPARKKVAKEKVPKQKLSVGKIIGRSFACIGTALAYIIVSVFILLGIIARGPSITLRNALVLSAMQASATKWVPGLFLSDEVVQSIVDKSYIDSKVIVDMEQYVPSEDDKENEFKDYPDGLKYIPANYPNFKAYIMLVSDPKRVYVGTSSNNFNTAGEGKRIFAMAKQENFIAAINGGEFADDGGVGNGARPMGLTYSKGNCVWNDGNKRTFIGISNDNKLVVTESMTKAQADEIGIRDAVSFQKGNVLISTENGETQAYYKPWNTGAAQRTAIGQRADGTFIFVVTDGRTASSIGATYDEMINIMLSYGAVTAALLDGGSSSMMYYENYYEKYDIDKSKLDEYQLQGLANKYKAFTPPRRIPTYFCVSR